MAKKRKYKKVTPEDDTVDLPSGEDTLELPPETTRLSDLIGDGEDEDIRKLEKAVEKEDTDYSVNAIKGGEREKTGRMGVRKTDTTKLGDRTAELLSRFPWEWERAFSYACGQGDQYLMGALRDAKDQMEKNDYKALMGLVTAVEHVYEGIVPEDIQGLLQCIRAYTGKGKE